MTCKLDQVCDQLRIKLHGIDRRLEALKGNAMALSEKSQGVVESRLDPIEQRIYDSRVSVDAAHTPVKTCHDGKKAGFDANREVWKKGASLSPARTAAPTTPRPTLSRCSSSRRRRPTGRRRPRSRRSSPATTPTLHHCSRLEQTRIWQRLRDPARRAADNRAEGTVTATLLGARTRYRPLATTTDACCRSSRPSRRRATANSGADGGPATGAPPALVFPGGASGPGRQLRVHRLEGTSP